MEKTVKSYKIEELSELLNGTLIGHTSEEIIEPEQIESAEKQAITFIGHKKYISLWENSKASAAIVNKSLGLKEPGANRAFIEVENADLAMAQLLDLFTPPPVQLNSGIHPSAVVDSTAKLGEGVVVGANSYIGPGVRIGNNSQIYPNVTILDDVEIGSHTIVKSGTVIAERCIIGHYSILQANVSIGSDGFGYRPSPDGKGIVKITHIGNVIIGNQVEIGSSTCIDRGKFSSTTIGDATKIDNLVQIGHNCVIGRACLIAGSCGISGSVTLGDGVVMAGQVAVKDHVTIGNGVTIGGKSGIINDIPDGQTILGFPAVEAKETLKQWAILRRLVKNR
ncbi:UDP-3-O-(3-hydroxymyristoyl)glucosamine N-acyltransferase [Lutimonas zeaxanthinifaciens]|uniref:UDP-3-O-(3-hydroxymyristoyl)glucosamine N-acyltransferase n=1 Tax=Lutimonas zeaxanthinifaciens TaxID=3060215 RepID=UPI00265D06E1|nr:UDP-3-O-(3-hydroxymyristoyl)glucosamine N-acyltransferase [Lutimonas sp. YSD2104]WKK66051.1 UDP-3-O-(3-hydroxymyristoyl)glucosamine N-acyltransferase [Lutimonas sp. YSD2104]